MHSESLLSQCQAPNLTQAYLCVFAEDKDKLVLFKQCRDEGDSEEEGKPAWRDLCRENPERERREGGQEGTEN